jgi:uncharacterized membrane protein YkvA (DUF1232 family)
MEWWQQLLIVIGIVLLIGVAGLSIAWWRTARDRASLGTFLKEQGEDLIRLLGRLRPVAADPRTPRRARWWLIGLALYVASPIDPLPDFIPVIGQLDEFVIVPLVLVHIRRLIPPELWREYFPPRHRP